MSSILIILCFLFVLIAAQEPTLLASYPACAARCQVITNTLPSSPCASNPNNVTCACDSPNRAATAGCEKVTCTPTEYTTTQTLAQQLCGPLYANNTLNPTAVTSAIASATSAAAAAIAGKDVTDATDYPPCAQSCLAQYLPASGCGSLGNVSCVCASPAIVVDTGRCELQSCNPADLAITTSLAQAICARAGGIGNSSAVANETIAGQANGSVPVAPTGGPVVPFTGGASGIGGEMGGWMVLVGGLAVGYLML
ncbi:MAG: hypothetical protein LQ339_006425 [Xanthoria mediterranea]|nr:MAG: hypothetical protein LQ339_006425 [Xanthoria mediterranea]